MDDRSSFQPVSAMNHGTSFSRRRRSTPMETPTNISVPEAHMFQSMSPSSLNAGVALELPNAFKADLDGMTSLDVFHLPQSSHQIVGLESANWPSSFLDGMYDNLTYLEGIENIRPGTSATRMGSDSHSLTADPPTQITNEPPDQTWLYPNPIETSAPMSMSLC